MVKTLAVPEDLLAFFNQVVDLTYGDVQEVLNGEEWAMFKHWLSLYSVQRATYELQRARRRIQMHAEPVYTLAEAEAQTRQIDDTLKLWNDLVTSVGGNQHASDLLIGAGFCGHWVR